MTNKIDEIEIEWPPDMLAKKCHEMRDILRAFDGATRDLDSDPTVIYSSKGDRLRRFFVGQERWAKVWSRPDLCMYESCTEKSVPRSHSIPMSASIKLIAEAGHVVTPQFGRNGVCMKRIGIREASTFPGFCKHHESLFAQFETEKKMSSDQHYLLQAFRTLCREIFRMCRHKERLESALNQYRELRNGFIVARLHQAHHSKSIKNQDITFENDEIERRTAEAIDSLSENLPILKGLYRDLFDDIQNDTNESSLIVMDFDFRLPVCLSGAGMLNYMQGDATKRALCILAIIPEEQKTKVILGAAKEHMNALVSYCADETSPRFLAMMESWLCHGSDHWFMTPSEWHAIPESRQKVILERILDPSLSIVDPVEFSILDSTRRQIVDLIGQALSRGDFSTGQRPDIIKLLASEKRKLDDFTNLPPSTGPGRMLVN